jgi:hypothetical protein
MAECDRVNLEPAKNIAQERVAEFAFVTVTVVGP